MNLTEKCGSVYGRILREEKEWENVVIILPSQNKMKT